MIEARGAWHEWLAWVALALLSEASAWAPQKRAAAWRVQIGFACHRHEAETAGNTNREVYEGIGPDGRS